MLAYVIADSPVESRILMNILKNQNIESKHILTPNEIDKSQEESGEVLIFIDWDSPQLNTAQKTALVQNLRKTNKEQVFIAGSDSSKQEILDAINGEEEQVISKPIETEAIKRKIGKIRKASFSKMEYDVQVLNAFIKAVVTTYETMIGFKPTRKKVYLLEPNSPDGIKEALSDISGVMGLSGDYHGSLVLSLPVQLALKSTAMMTGEPEKTSLDKDVRDCIGEIVNIVSGQAKSLLTKTPYKFELSLPTVIVGKGHKVHIQEDSPTLAIIFDAEGYLLTLQANIRPTKKGE